MDADFAFGVELTPPTALTTSTEFVFWLKELATHRHRIRTLVARLHDNITLYRRVVERAEARQEELNLPGQDLDAIRTAIAGHLDYIAEAEVFCTRIDDAECDLRARWLSAMKDGIASVHAEQELVTSSQVEQPHS